MRHALFDEDGAEPVNLLKTEKVNLGQEAHVLAHAIGAAEVAAIRHRDAQIVHHPAKRVHHRRVAERVRRERIHENTSWEAALTASQPGT
jgi:hypothetical protein